MTRYVYKLWLEDLGNYVADHKFFLILDNCFVHIKDVDPEDAGIILQNTTLLFIPPNASIIIQISTLEFYAT